MFLYILPSSAFLFVYTLRKQSGSFNDLSILFCNLGLNISCSHPFDGSKTKGKQES